MPTADFLVVGGGIAGLSLAARLTDHGRVAVFEAEQALGRHSSGRSAAFSHFGIGNATVRAMTAWSRAAFVDPPGERGDAPLSRPAAALFVATEEMLGRLAALEGEMEPFAPRLRRLEGKEMKELVPSLRTGAGGLVAGTLDPDGLRLDSDALLQAYARRLRAGGTLKTGCRVTAIARDGADWRVRADGGEDWTGPVLIDAAGAWADAVAGMAGIRPLGLRPLRRTIIVIDPPAGASVRDWPFVKTAEDDFYILPEAGRLLASPVDEVESAPCDAQPEDYDIALAAWKVERYTTLTVSRIAGRWAGLRTFAADRVPVAGFAPDAPGFFWLAGQGGYGLQTAPAMAAAAEALITRAPWPETLREAGVTPDLLAPGRLYGGASH